MRRAITKVWIPDDAVITNNLINSFVLVRHHENLSVVTRPPRPRKEWERWDPLPLADSDFSIYQ